MNEVSTQPRFSFIFSGVWNKSTAKLKRTLFHTTRITVLVFSVESAEQPSCSDVELELIRLQRISIFVQNRHVINSNKSSTSNCANNWLCNTRWSEINICITLELRLQTFFFQNSNCMETDEGSNNSRRTLVLDHWSCDQRIRNTSSSTKSLHWMAERLIENWG